jgi:hypothetical protein
MNEDSVPIMPGRIECPPWCTHHTGELAGREGFVDDDATMDDAYTTGRHGHSLYINRRHDADKSPVAVEVWQSVSKAGEWAPEILMWHGVTGVKDEPGMWSFKRRAYIASEARAMGEALIQAADMVEQILTGRCECGEAIKPDAEKCISCSIAENVATHDARRANLRVVR